MLRMLKASNREEIQRAGVIWDDYLHAMEGEARFKGRCWATLVTVPGSTGR